ncbi:unnamed protein product [Amoebophrya sp. A120]|nr:unnamed protein product [Amoebophrya sp. A120]|eukprot:GSA120T00014981001.1
MNPEQLSTSPSTRRPEDRYRIQSDLGRGSFGFVQKCFDTVTKEIVCLKTIDVGGAGNNYTTSASSPAAASEEKKKNQVLDFALQEVAVLKQLNCAHIVKCLDSFRKQADSTSICIVMEYCANGDLAQLLKQQGFLPESVALLYSKHLATALAHCHQHKVLHRDLKPRNIFLSSNYELRLGDFGVCKIQDATGELASTMIGTPLYLCPEICQNVKYDEKSDCWGLGTISYEMFTGVAPFAPRQGNFAKGDKNQPPPAAMKPAAAIILQIATAQLKTEDLAFRVSNRHVVSCVSQCLSKRPQRRPSCAAACQVFAKAIESLKRLGLYEPRVNNQLLSDRPEYLDGDAVAESISNGPCVSNAAVSQNSFLYDNHCGAASNSSTSSRTKGVNKMKPSPSSAASSVSIIDLSADQLLEHAPESKKSAARGPGAGATGSSSSSSFLPQRPRKDSDCSAVSVPPAASGPGAASGAPPPPVVSSSLFGAKGRGGASSSSSSSAKDHRRGSAPCLVSSDSNRSSLSNSQSESRLEPHPGRGSGTSSTNKNGESSATSSLREYDYRKDFHKGLNLRPLRSARDKIGSKSDLVPGEVGVNKNKDKKPAGQLNNKEVPLVEGLQRNLSDILTVVGKIKHAVSTPRDFQKITSSSSSCCIAEVGPHQVPAEEERPHQLQQPAIIAATASAPAAPETASASPTEENEDKRNKTSAAADEQDPARTATFASALEGEAGEEVEQDEAETVKSLEIVLTGETDVAQKSVAKNVERTTETEDSVVSRRRDQLQHYEQEEDDSDEDATMKIELPPPLPDRWSQLPPQLPKVVQRAGHAAPGAGSSSTSCLKQEQPLPGERSSIIKTSPRTSSAPAVETSAMKSSAAPVVEEESNERRDEQAETRTTADEDELLRGRPTSVRNDVTQKSSVKTVASRSRPAPQPAGPSPGACSSTSSSSTTGAEPATASSSVPRPSSASPPSPSDDNGGTLTSTFHLTTTSCGGGVSNGKDPGASPNRNAAEVLESPPPAPPSNAPGHNKGRVSAKISGMIQHWEQKVKEAEDNSSAKGDHLHGSNATGSSIISNSSGSPQKSTSKSTSSASPVVSGTGAGVVVPPASKNNYNLSSSSSSGTSSSSCSQNFAVAAKEKVKSPALQELLAKDREAQFANGGQHDDINLEKTQEIKKTSSFGVTTTTPVPKRSPKAYNLKDGENCCNDLLRTNGEAPRPSSGTNPHGDHGGKQENLNRVGGYSPAITPSSSPGIASDDLDKSSSRLFLKRQDLSKFQQFSATDSNAEHDQRSSAGIMAGGKEKNNNGFGTANNSMFLQSVTSHSQDDQQDHLVANLRAKISSLWQDSPGEQKDDINIFAVPSGDATLRRELKQIQKGQQASKTNNASSSSGGASGFGAGGSPHQEQSSHNSKDVESQSSVSAQEEGRISEGSALHGDVFGKNDQHKNQNRFSPASSSPGNLLTAKSWKQEAKATNLLPFRPEVEVVTDVSSPAIDYLSLAREVLRKSREVTDKDLCEVSTPGVPQQEEPAQKMQLVQRGQQVGLGAPLFSGASPRLSECRFSETNLNLFNPAPRTTTAATATTGPTRTVVSVSSSSSSASAGLHQQPKTAIGAPKMSPPAVAIVPGVPRSQILEDFLSKERKRNELHFGRPEKPIIAINPAGAPGRLHDRENTSHLRVVRPRWSGRHQSDKNLLHPRPKIEKPKPKSLPQHHPSSSASSFSRPKTRLKQRMSIANAPHHTALTKSQRVRANYGKLKSTATGGMVNYGSGGGIRPARSASSKCILHVPAGTGAAAVSNNSKSKTPSPSESVAKVVLSTPAAFAPAASPPPASSLKVLQHRPRLDQTPAGVVVQKSKVMKMGIKTSSDSCDDVVVSAPRPTAGPSSTASSNSRGGAAINTGTGAAPASSSSSSSSRPVCNAGGQAQPHGAQAAGMRPAGRRVTREHVSAGTNQNVKKAPSPPAPSGVAIPSAAAASTKSSAPPSSSIDAAARGSKRAAGGPGGPRVSAANKPASSTTSATARGKSKGKAGGVTASDTPTSRNPKNTKAFIANSATRNFSQSHQDAQHADHGHQELLQKKSVQSPSIFHPASRTTTKSTTASGLSGSGANVNVGLLLAPAQQVQAKTQIEFHQKQQEELQAGTEGWQRVQNEIAAKEKVVDIITRDEHSRASATTVPRGLLGHDESSQLDCLAKAIKVEQPPSSDSD